MPCAGPPDVAKLAWQLRAARWGGKGGSGYLHPDFGGYARRPLCHVHSVLLTSLRELEGKVQPQRVALFEAFYGLAAPPMETHALAELFGLSSEGVRRAIRAVEGLVLQELPRQRGTATTCLQPVIFDGHRPTALSAIAAALTEAVGDHITVSALNELRGQADPGWRGSDDILQGLSRMARLRVRRRAAQLAGYHQQRINEDHRVRTLVPTPRQLSPPGHAVDLEKNLAAYSDILPSDHDTAVDELTRKPGPDPQFVTVLALTANHAFITAERDIEPFLSVIAAQFARCALEPESSRAFALATVQGVRAALAREVEDLSSLHYADSVLRLVGPVHPLGRRALRDAALTFRAHGLFSAASACIRELGTVVRALPDDTIRDEAMGQFFSDRIGLALSMARARAAGHSPQAPADLVDLVSRTTATASQIVRRNPDSYDDGLVATLRRRVAELAFTWPEAPQSQRVLAQVYEWADQARIVRLGKLQWYRTAMTVALQTKDEESFARWDKSAEAMANGAPWHFTVLHEIADVRRQAQVLGLIRDDHTQQSRLIAASASDLARLSRYTARPLSSGSRLFIGT